MMAARRTIVAGFAAAAAAGVSGFAGGAARAASETGTTNPPASKDVILLRIAGDDVAGTSIIPLLAQDFLNRQGANNVQIRPGTPPWTTRVSGTRLSGETVSILIGASTTEIGYQLLEAGTIDIWLAGRAATAAQMTELSKGGKVDFLGIARYGIAVAVDAANPLRTISYDQLRDVYSGRIADWQELGGSPGPIHLYGRAPGSASREAFLTNIMGDTPLSGSVREYTRFSEIRTALLNDPDGISYIPVNFAAGLRAVGLTVRGRIPAQPYVYGLETEDYPLSNTVTLYRIVKNGSGLAEIFLRRAVSARAEYLILAQGYSLTLPILLLPRIDPPVPSEYLAVTPNGLRVSTTIHFEPGSTVPDAAELRKLDALAAYLRRLGGTPEELAHLGFSEDTGDPAKNQAISLELATVVADELRHRGMVPGEVIPFGAALLLASDAVPAGQRANRRVETWIRP